VAEEVNLAAGLEEQIDLCGGELEQKKGTLEE
jgi:hypothetical protein